MLSTIHIDLHGRSRQQIKTSEVNANGHINRQVRLGLHALSECSYVFFVFMYVTLLGCFSLWPLGGFLQAKGKVVFVRMCAGGGGHLQAAEIEEKGNTNAKG